MNNELVTVSNSGASIRYKLMPLESKDIEIDQIQKNILDCLFMFMDPFEGISHIGQERIASMIGVSRKTILLKIKALVSLGLLKKMYRQRTTCVYSFTKNFLDSLIMSKSIFSHLEQFINRLFKSSTRNPAYLSFMALVLKYRKKLSLIKFDTLINMNLLFNKFITSVYNLTGTKSLPTSKKTGYYCFKKQIKTRKAGSGMQNGVEYISPTLEKITKELHLNLWGKIKLSAYCDVALEYAYQQARYEKNLKDPFYFIGKVAYQYCVDRKILINKKFAEHLAQKHNMPAKPETYYLPKPTISIPVPQRQFPDYKYKDQKIPHPMFASFAPEWVNLTEKKEELFVNPFSF